MKITPKPIKEPVDPRSLGIYIITGATDATGSLITRRIAAQGKPVVLASYNLEKSQRLAQELIETTGNKDITCLRLNLSSFEDVREFVAEVKQLDRPVAALINNASYVSTHSEISPDGFEKVVQINFLSTVLLSMLISPMMQEGGKIILSTLQARNFVTLPYEFPAVNSFIPLATYLQSKRALTLFSIYMSTVMRTRHIAVNCVDPGIINKSMISMNRWFGKFDLSLDRLHNPQGGVKAIIRALESADTGFIFKGQEKQFKTSSLLKNREVFIRLCNDTMRLIKKEMPTE